MDTNFQPKALIYKTFTHHHHSRLSNIIICLFLASLIIGCSSKNRNEIILKIGQYKLTNNELKQIIETQSNLNKKQLENTLIEEGHILAYGLAHHYDTINILKNKLKYASRLYASQVDGFVWNKKIKPLLKVDKKIVLDTYQKRSREFELELVHFSNQEAVDTYINDKLNPHFKALKLLSQSTPEITYTKLKLLPPFSPFGAYIEGIEDGKIGDIWGPVETLNGYYIVCIANIKRIQQKDIKQEFPIVEKELIQNLIEGYTWTSQQNIFSEMQPFIQDSVLKNLMLSVVQEQQGWLNINPNIVLMRYSFRGEKKTFTVGDFIELTRCQPFYYGSLTNYNDVTRLLKEYLIDTYLFSEAQKMGMENNSDYIFFRKNYQNRLWITHFKEENIPQIIINVNEVENYYKENISRYKSFETATISVFKFEDMQTAYKSRHKIEKQFTSNSENDDTSNESTNFSFVQQIKIQPSDTSNNTTLINTIHQTSEGQITLPIEIDEKFWLIYLWEKEGSSNLPFKYVKANIEQLLIQEQRQKAYADLLTELKSNYPVSKNLVKDYLSKSK